jgi:hypothetical protein
MTPKFPLGPSAYFRSSRDYSYEQGACFQSLSLEEVSTKFDRSIKEWEGSTCSQTLSRMFAQEQNLFLNVVITQCVCIALDTFVRSILLEEDCMYKILDEVNSSMRQLVALTKMLDLLKTTHAITNIYF